MSEDASATPEGSMLSFKVKVSSRETPYDVTIPETSTVLELKNKLSGKDYEDVPVNRLRLIYSGRVLKDNAPLSQYTIKPGNTIHLVKSAASAPTPSSSSQDPAVPTNISAGIEANNPLAGLTGARYAGQVNLPNRSMFGADGGMGAPPNEDQIADMLSNPNTAQMMNEALNDPQMIDLMIQTNPTLRAMGPQAREILQSPMFRSMMTDPNLLRQAAAMGRPRGGGGSFAAPGETPTAEGAATTGAAGAGAAGTGERPGLGFPGMNMSPEAMDSMMRIMGGGPAGGAGASGLPDLASLLNPGGTPSATSANPISQNSARDATPGAGTNSFADLLAQFGAGGAGANPFAGGLPPPTPEQIEHAQRMLAQLGAGGAGVEGAMMPPWLGMGGAGLGAAGAAPAAPADTRPPEEQYAEQLRQLNDMGFFDFEENVRALRRAGGSVQGAINQLLG